MVLFYNLGIRLYTFFIWIASAFNKKAKQFILGRKGLFASLEAFKQASSTPIAWFHAASLGEFEQGLPVIEKYKATFPDHRILVTFFSPSGYENRKNHPSVDFSCYLPVDTKRNAKRFVSLLKPEIVFFIKYEYWFHHLNQVHLNQIPLYSISALFTPSHIFFKGHGAFHRRMLQFFDFTFVQNEASLRLLQSIGVAKASVSGDTRFDRVLKTIEKPDQYPEIGDFKGASKLCIMGSAWPSDMEVLNDFINRSETGLKFIIAPHIVDPDHVKKIVSGITKSCHSYSKSKDIPEDTEVLILDTIGMLSSIYQYGDFAYIGGAFGDGLHNILEAVAFGLPVVYGNKGLEKFPESITLQELKGGFVIDSQKSAHEILTKLNQQDDFRKAASEICKQFVLDNAEATMKIMNYLKTSAQ